MRFIDLRLRWVAVAIGVAIALTGCGDPVPLNRGDRAPGFALVAVAGPTVRFPVEGEGAPTVIRFWADWCAYCYQEMKDLEPVAWRLEGGAPDAARRQRRAGPGNGAGLCRAARD